MEQDLKLRGLGPATIRNYLLYFRKVTVHPTLGCTCGLAQFL